MTTKLIRSLHNMTSKAQGGVVTIGNFDGVHLGHQRLLSEVKSMAEAKTAPSVVITFEPHPFEYFGRENLKIPRITRLREKFSALAACGVDYVLVLPFKQELAQMTAQAFVNDILYRALRIQEMIIGDDFHFGYKRQGDVRLLEKMGQELGFTVRSMPTFLFANERVSSTRVRKALADGDYALVERLLGHPYTMMGRVSVGKQLGRQWGFPTANIFLHRQLTPITGIYTVYVHGLAAHPLPGVASLGTRPTVDGTTTLLEVHLLDFNQEIYGRYVQIEFCKKLRDEIRYPNVDLLIQQIKQDVDEARHYFQARGEYERIQRNA